VSLHGNRVNFNIAGHGPVHPDPEDRCNQLRQCFAKKGTVTSR